MSDSGTAPFVSVVIPARNRRRAIQECVSACLGMDYPAGRFEILVVDDGSQPPLQPFHDARVQLIPQPASGPAAARNRGIRAASGPLVAFTDDDCRPRAEWLSRLVAVHMAEPDALIGGHTVNALSENLYSAASQLLIDQLYAAFERQPHERFFTANNLAGAREKLLAVGGFDEGFPLAAAEDRDLCDRWRAGGGTLHYVPAAIVDHYHSMSFAGFLRQQLRYGRGARLLSVRRAKRDVTYSPQPLGFYMGLLARLFQAYPLSRAIRMSGLLVFAHIANLAGFIAERGGRK